MKPRLVNPRPPKSACCGPWCGPLERPVQGGQVLSRSEGPCGQWLGAAQLGGTGRAPPCLRPSAPSSPPSSQAQLESQALALVLRVPLPSLPTWFHSVWGKDTARWLHVLPAFLEHPAGALQFALCVVYVHFAAKQTEPLKESGMCVRERHAGDPQLALDGAGVKPVAPKRLSVTFPFILGQQATHRRMGPQRAGVSCRTKQPRWDSVSPYRKWAVRGQNQSQHHVARARPAHSHLHPIFPSASGIGRSLILRSGCSGRFAHGENK